MNTNMVLDITLGNTHYNEIIFIFYTFREVTY